MQVGSGTAVPAPAPRPAAPVRIDGGPRPCPVCRRTSAVDRLLCRACGAELDTGRPLAVWTGALDAAPVAERRGGGRRRERVLQVGVGLAIAVALVVGPLRFLGVGPFGAPERLDAAVLLAAGYPGPAVLLEVDAVATTTTVAGVVDRDVVALNLIDGDVATAWIGAPVDDLGAGEVIDLTLAEPAWVARVEVRNGDHRSSDAYERSDRWLTGVLTLDGGRSYRVDLLDVGLEAQVIELPRPELTTRVSLRVERVFEGTAARGVALSEITVVGWTAGAADAALARERARTP
jgi:hypothetical protein